MIGNEEFVREAVPAVVKLSRVTNRYTGASITGAIARNDCENDRHVQAFRQDLEGLVRAWDEAQPIVDEIKLLLGEFPSGDMKKQ